MAGTTVSCLASSQTCFNRRAILKMISRWKENSSSGTLLELCFHVCCSSFFSSPWGQWEAVQLSETCMFARGVLCEPE